MVRLNPAAGLEVHGSHADTYAIFGPPRGGKSTWLSTAGLAAPGAVLFTSTRADLATDTAKPRSRKGPVWFLNPGHDGGFPSTLHYSPLAGCEDPRMAMEAAGALMHAAPRDTSGRNNYWDHQSKTMLQFLLHAAALEPQADIFTVMEWASNPEYAGYAVKVLDDRGTPRWAQRLLETITMAANDEKYWSAISSGVITALSWLDDPALGDLACPLPGEEFDARQFIREQGTVYAIGADTPHNPQSAYFACFTTYLWNTAKRMAADPYEEASRRLKLDPVFTAVIDEPAITCRVPLDRWATEAAGHGITLITGFQSDAQLREMFGDHAGQVLEDLFTVKLVTGGVTGAIAEKASKWGGKRDTWHGSKDQLHQEEVFQPERICNLAPGRIFVKHRYTRAFIAEYSRIEDHPLYERAQPADFPAPVRLPSSLPALEPPRQSDPIAPPYARPAVAEPDPIPVLTGTVTDKEPSWAQ